MVHVSESVDRMMSAVRGAFVFGLRSMSRSLDGSRCAASDMMHRCAHVQ
jgi:hypothetical protein